MIIDLWELMKDYVPEKKRKDFLFEMFKVLEDYDIFVADLKDLKGEDRWIDMALEDYVDADLEDEDDEEEW
jgi:hypothetical protein